MLFQKKIDTAFEKLHEKKESSIEEEKKAGRGEEPSLEKHDLLAMFIAAAGIFLPAVLIVLGILALVGTFFFFH